MTIEGAIIKEQGVTFAIVAVKKHILDSTFQSNQMIKDLSLYFPNMPIVLVSGDNRGIPNYYGRKDIVNFLANIHPSRIPWKKYTF